MKIARVPQCHPEKPHTAFGLCRSCYRKVWHKQNPTIRRMATCHPDKKNGSGGLCYACYYKANPTRRKASRRKYYEKKRSELLTKHKDWYGKLKDEVFSAYGQQCECCSETTSEFLSIDHINGNGSVHRKQVSKGRSGSTMFMWLKRNGFPKDNFRLLCMNCNWSRGMYGYCPHENKTEKVRQP